MKFNDIAKELKVPLNEASTYDEVADTLNRIAKKNNVIKISWLIGQRKAIKKAPVTYTDEQANDIYYRLKQLNPNKDPKITSEIDNLIAVIRTKAPV